MLLVKLLFYMTTYGFSVVLYDVSFKDWKLGDKICITPPVVPIFSVNVLLAKIIGPWFALIKIGTADSNSRTNYSSEKSASGSNIYWKA